jgi:hypothetical protein
MALMRLHPAYLASAEIDLYYACSPALRNPFLSQNVSQKIQETARKYSTPRKIIRKDNALN